MELATLVKNIESNPDLASRLKADPLATLKSEDARNPLVWDAWIYRIGVVALALVALGAMSGAMALAAYTKTVPDMVVSLGSSALGALAGLLVPSPIKPG